MNSIAETKVIEGIAEMRQWRGRLYAAGESGGSVGFVPTMGALHEGHLTLIRQAAKECQHVVVSIFVNPMQFGPNEDFKTYPRTFERDLQLCREAGAQLVFHPGPQDLYHDGKGSATKVVPPVELTEKLCGIYRPGFYTGVATVVLKLFSIVSPTRAYFGEKDYQQLCVIRRMVTDFNLPIDIVPVPTVRAEDGLALSSRNVYLDAKQRDAAPELHQILCAVRDDVSAGKSLDAALEIGRKRLSAIPGFLLQYLEACDAYSLETLSEARKPMVVLIAGKLGSVRLIDNIVIA